MTSDPCDGCGRDVRIAGGGTNLWTLEGDRGEGMTLELEDGSERFLCFECIESLPDPATTEDVASIDRSADAHADEDDEDRPSDETRDEGTNPSAAFPAGLTIGAVGGLALGAIAGEPRAGAWVGAAVGALIGLAWPSLRHVLRT